MTASGLWPLQGVLFDMDGLLVDSEPLWFQAERAVMARLGGPWGPADQQALLGGSLERTVSYLLGKAASDGHAGGPRPGAAEVGRWLLDEMTGLMLDRGLQVLPGARELVAEVAGSGVPYALVTSSQRRIMRTVLEVTGLTFAVTVCREDVERGKPDPEPYLRAAGLLEVDPGGCAALEDSPNGIAAAEAAGCTVIAVPSLPVPGVSGWVTVGSLGEVSLARLRAAVAGRRAGLGVAGAFASMCDDESECRQG